MSLIENLWGLLKDMQKKKQAISAEGHKKIACKVWKGITPDYLNNLYKAMPRHMQAVIDAKGGHIKY